MNKQQITSTVYDAAYAGFVGISPQPTIQRNLRNRVSYTSFANGSNPANYNQASFYTYDIEGNVDTLLQDYGSSDSTASQNVMNMNSNRWKKTVYQYDLVSGKVNTVAYQPGLADQFYHRYTYDAENRLTLAETSADSINWESEARYQYYKHGPLARVVIGDQQVQGIDYAYTLQGWLKGVNSSSLTIGYDMGRDGDTTYMNRYVAKDAFEYNLTYYAGDYSPISSTVAAPFAGYTALFSSPAYKSLWNGNISSMVVNIGKFNNPLLYMYTYDQLNRLTGMDVDSGLNQSTNSWSSGLTSISDYKERIAYDPNGNITQYLRNGTNTVNLSMDSLNYFYNKSGGKLVNNQLNYIRDQIGSSNYPNDIDNQSANNYAYDSIGNLISDNAEGITSISWSVYGKILEIQRTATGSNPTNDIQYTYDAAGNRISKRVKISSNAVTYTWYSRDAQGNVMSTYTAAGSGATLTSYSLALSEQHLYGSSRLGIASRTTDMKASYSPGAVVNFQRGLKSYELSNHLGNVLVTVSDKKNEVSSNGTTIDNFTADIRNANDYYPFGMQQPGRLYTASSNYRYGFNGKENDNEVKGSGNEQDYGMRIYDPRGGRFLSVDPLINKYPELTPYQFASNTPIQATDLDGKERLDVSSYDAKTRTANIQIVKNVYVNTNNIPAQVAAMGNDAFSSIFNSGNTILYVSGVPQNGQPAQFISKKDFDKGGGYKLDITYNVNIQNTTTPNAIDVSNAANSLVQSGAAAQFSNPLTFARADANNTGVRTNNVYVNPNFAGFNPSSGLDESTVPSYEELIAHEVGFHNMERRLHTPDNNGNAVYPTGKTLESNLPGQIKPSKDDTRAILNGALLGGNLNDYNSQLPKPPVTSGSSTTPTP